MLTIDRPERRNAVDAETAGAAARRATGASRPTTRPGCWCSPARAPEAFCAGADLKAIAEAAPELTPEAIDAVASRPEGPMGFTRLTPSKPTIAAISGWCLAGGLELALWCDLRIATETARLGFTERRFGVPLIDGGTQRLPLIVGMGRALEMILTGRVVEAQEALAWGLVNEVVAEGGHLERALEIAEGLAAFPQTTMLSDRRAAIEGSGLPLAEGLTLEAELGRASIETGARGAAALRRRRGPRRRGRGRLSRPASCRGAGTRSAGASRSRPRSSATTSTWPSSGVPRSLVASRSSTWKMPAELFILISTLTASSSPASIDDLVDRRRRERVDPDSPGVDRHARAALGHVERVGDAHHAGLERVGLAAAPVADDRVQGLGDDDRALGLPVGVVEQLPQLPLGQEQAVGLVVGAVDRHADVVKQRPAAPRPPRRRACPCRGP